MRFLGRSLLGLFLLGSTIGLLVLAGDVLYSSIQERLSSAPPQRPQRERTYSANVVATQAANLSPTMLAFGEIVSSRTLEVRAPAGGTVVELSSKFVEGGVVSAGETILRIDPSNAEYALDLAIADSDDALVALRDAERLLELAIDEHVAAEQQVMLRKRAYDRYITLLDRGVGTTADVENSEIALSAAIQSDLTRKKAVAQAETRLEQAETAVSRRNISVSDAQRRLEDTHLQAEFDGAFADVNVVEGGLVTPNERLAHLIDPNALEVSFRISNVQYSRLLDERGDLLNSNVQISLDLDGLSLSATGQIVRESPAVGQGQTGRLLFAKIPPDQSRGMLPGDFVNVTIEEPELRNVFVLPAASVNSKSEVLVVGDQNRLESVAVIVLRGQQDNVLIRSRELDGKMVVSERSPVLAEGIRINPVRTGEGDAPSFEEPVMVALSDAERTRLVEVVEGNQFMPAQVKERILQRLQQEEVPKDLLDRLGNRAGG